VSAPTLHPQPIAHPPPAPFDSATSAVEERVVSRPLGLTWPRLLLIVAIAAYALWFSWLTLSRFWALEARALDMGNLHQAIWNTAHGNWFHQTNQPGSTNRLSLHVEPILLPIAALFRLFPHVEFLLVLQSLVVALGAWPLFALGERKFAPSIGPTRAGWLALVFAVGWLTMPAIQAANWLEFHPVTLAPTFFLAAFYFLVERRAGWFALFAVLAAACKEDLGLIVFLMGLYAFVAQRQRRLGALTMALGLGWSLVAVLGIQNSFGGNIHWGRYDWLGSEPTEILRTLITRPVYVWQHVMASGAARYLFELLAPMAFLALLAPHVFLLALPSLGVNLLADFPPMHQVDTLIYAAPIAPFVALAAVMGTARLLEWLAHHAAELGAGWRTALRVAPWGLAALLAAAYVASQAAWGYLPGGANARLFRPTAHDARAQAFIARIGRDDAVSAQDKLNPHTAGRTTSFIFPRVDDPAVGNADVVLLDVTGPAWPLHPNDLHSSVQDLLAGEFGVEAAGDGYLLLRRGETARTLPSAFYTPWTEIAPGMAEVPPPTNAPVRFGDNLELLGVEVGADEFGEVVVHSRWRTLQPLQEPVTLQFVYQAIDGSRPFDSRFYPPVATLWYPVDKWPVGESTFVSTLPWALEGDTLGLLVGASTGQGAAEQPLPMTGAPPQWQADDGRMLNLGLFAAQPTSRLTRAGEWRPVREPPSPLPQTTFAAAGIPQLTLAGAAVGASTVISGAPTLPVTIQWRVAGTPAADYSVFVHLLDDAGNKVAQWDGAPRQGYTPLATSRLEPGDELTGEAPLTLPAGLRGAYTLVAGLYDWQTGTPLTLADGATSFPIGTVRLP
jgi:uncharacterized membrane protein